jgi:hypothetical protein
MKDSPMTNQAAVDNPRMDADVVCVGFAPAFDLKLQFATSKNQPSHQPRFPLSIPVTNT